MTAAFTLWGHALVALLFASVALREWRRPRGERLGTVFMTALALSTLWALALAGIGGRDLITRLAEAARNLAWLGFAFALVRRDRAGGWTLTAVYLAVAGVVVASAGLVLIESVAKLPAVRGELASARLVFGMMAAAGALVLARHLHAAAPERGGMRAIALALALMWGVDLMVFATAYADGRWADTLAAVRGFGMVAVTLLLGVAAQRRGGWTLALSRTAASHALIAVALVIYLGLVACLTAAAGAWGGNGARALQAGVVIGAATALLTLLSGSWAAAWAKVKLAKHLFRHRYDYRVEWQRFTDTLSRTGEPLERRVVTAVATLLDAPAGLLLTLDGARLRAGAAWRWDDADGLGGGEALAAHLTTRRIVELDSVRAGRAAADAAVLPEGLVARKDAWALVPLLHGETLAGAVLLARPPVPRALDWEDFDLLRVAGRQAASYLAEDRSGRALAEAERFDEFNRRFAFIVHDIKNLVSQQLLVARNAERHAANPEFRADMVATLTESADRMTTLLARLSHQEPAPGEPLGAVDLASLVERVARGRRAQHPVRCDTRPLWAWAHPQRLEQLLSHLVQNAVEASPAGEPITLRVVAAGDRVAMEVVDRGAGMSPAFVRDELFRPFSSTKAGGFGVGAFEARQLVGAMGGAIEVDSREGEGTCFRVVLPVAARMEEAA